MWGWLADMVLAVHVGVVAFVVLGWLLVVIGNLWTGWHWVNHPLFRIGHLLAIAVVVAEAWLGLACPLTTWEQMLRARATGVSYEGGFIQHWLQRLLYHDAPPWVFTVGYTLFALLVVLAWRRWPPRRRRRPSPREPDGHLRSETPLRSKRAG